jgi:hypothetical protein
MVPSRSFSAPRPLSPSSTLTQGVGSAATRGSRSKEPLSAKEEDDRPQQVLKAIPCASVTDKMLGPVEAEAVQIRTQADIEASETARAAEVATTLDLPAVASTSSNSREAMATVQQSDDRKAEAMLANGREVLDACEAVQPAFEGEERAEDLPAPVVQVGDLSFCLPPPALAVQRITELWRPGACMVVITTQHYGTPLLCPDGDIMKGLVNIAPSAEGGQQLVPLFWQNVEEAAQSALDQSNGHIPGQSEELAAMNSSALTRITRGGQLPTMVEEEEEELE